MDVLLVVSKIWVFTKFGYKILANTRCSEMLSNGLRTATPSGSTVVAATPVERTSFLTMTMGLCWGLLPPCDILHLHLRHTSQDSEDPITLPFPSYVPKTISDVVFEEPLLHGKITSDVGTCTLLV